MLTKTVDSEKIRKLQAYLDKGEKFVIVTHEMPDGDAIGSSLALCNYISSLEDKAVHVIVPNVFPKFLRWMPGAKDIVIHEQYSDFAAELIGNADVLFCLDLNAVRRTGHMASLVAAADAHKVMIDHHLDPEQDFCDVVISHPEMSSTCELIFRVICQLGAFEAIDKEMAECLYTGMMTDTGSFTYNSNQSEIYYIVSELIEKGIDKDEIYRRVNQVYSKYRLRMMGYVLYEKMKVYHSNKAALFTLSQRELNTFHYTPGDTEGFVNIPLGIRGVEFSAFLREETNLIKVSLRSLGEFPCNEFAAAYFNGGGHRNASGGEFYGTLDEAVQVFEEGLLQFNPNNFRKKLKKKNAQFRK